MHTSTFTQTQDHLSEMEARFKQLQSETISLATPVLFIFGILILGDTLHFPDTLITLPFTALIFILGGLALLLRRISFLIASCLLIISFIGIVLLATALAKLPFVVFLLILPIGITTITLGILTGIIMTLGFTLLLFLTPVAYWGGQSEMVMICSICFWCVVGMIWLTLRPLLTTAEWAWSGYEQSLEMLNQAQDLQARLLQYMENLKLANRNLVQLNQLAHNLRQTAEAERMAKERFVANVSHELRTPLNMIIGFCETILNSTKIYGDELPPILIADLEVILRNGQHLGNLIDDVLDLSQIDAGQMSLTLEQADFYDILEASRVAVRPLYDSKGLYLRTEIQENLPPVCCDRVRIREVLLNLLSNAGRFTEKGGVAVKVWREANRLLVSISDTGPGITEQDQSQLFKPFHQLDGSIRRRYGGTGLGLSISKSFVELHDGKMWVESHKDQGSTFYFSLPIQPFSPLETKAMRWINPYTTSWMHSSTTSRERPLETEQLPVKPRLVVVEKQGNTLTRLLGRFLGKAEIILIPDLDEALQDLSQVPARALIINDLADPDLILKLSDPSVLPYNTPAFLCAIPGVDQADEHLGITDYLVKPISQVRLLEALEQLGKPVSTILLVDDEPDVLQLFRRMLISSGRGYRVLRANDGQQALKILKRQTVDVILLDLIMPNMDGIQFLTARKEYPKFRNIPVILISARDPQGQSITTNMLAVTRGGGLSTQKLIACLEGLLIILAPLNESNDPMSPTAPPG